MWAKQSTAATLIVGPILDSAGAEYASAVIGDLSISKNGGTLTALAAAATLTHIANGQYTLVMTTGNLDTLGRLQITCNKSTYQMPPIGLNVVPAMVFDSMVLGTDVLQSDVTQFGGTAGTFAAGIPTAALDSDAQAMVTAFNAMRSGNVFTAPTLANAPTGGSGSGTGARTVTITVNDGTTVLQNARLRFTEGANTYTALTNASGVATFNLDDATYTVAVTKSGYTYAGTTMVVNGTETATYSMTAVSVTPPTNPDLSAVVVLCLGTDFEAESGVTIDLRIVKFPSGSTNTAYPGLKQTATSNGSGIATLEAPKGSVCEWKRGKEDSWTEITIGSDEQTNVTSIIGSRY